MTFVPRPQGRTLRRVEEAIHRPHDSVERMDPDFQVAMKCEKCGRVGHGPRRFMAEAMREHQQSECSARHVKADAPQVMRILYPRT